jgi:hypothetical protein
MTARNLPELAEALKNLTKYPDRPLIDYWRTIQGTPVGFHGKVGEGIPIAGPTVLTGSSAANNPLMKPLLKKYPEGTFIGDAIRKENFPISVVNFIEKFVGEDEAAIRARFQKIQSRIDAQMDDEFVESKKRIMIHAEQIRILKDATKKLGDQVRNAVANNDETMFAGLTDGSKKFLKLDFTKWDTDKEEYGWQKFFGHSGFLGGKIEFRLDSGAPKIDALKSILDEMNKESDELIKNGVSISDEDLKKSFYRDFYYGSNAYKKLIYTNPDYKGAAAMMMTHFRDPMGSASVAYKMLSLEGVAGTFTNKDFSKNMKSKEDIEKWMKKMCKKQLACTSYDKLKDYFGDLYVLNQIIMSHNGKKTERVTRGMGKVLAGLRNEKETKAVIEKMKEKNAPMHFPNRPVSGFASGSTSTFAGWTVTTDVPAEAILSSFEGAKIQMGDFPSERETLVLGASSLVFKPDSVRLVG